MSIEKLNRHDANTLSETDLDQVTGGVHPGEAFLNYVNETAEKVIKAVQRALR